MSAELDARLTRIEDRIAISELRARYAFLVDAGRGAEAVDLFTDDGEFHGPAVSYRGREEQLRHYAEHRLSAMWHFNTNEINRIDGATAAGECYCYMPCVLEGESYVCACRYDDELVKVGGDWRFTSRRVTFFYFVPLKDGWAANMVRPTWAQ